MKFIAAFFFFFKALSAKQQKKKAKEKRSHYNVIEQNALSDTYEKYFPLSSFKMCLMLSQYPCLQKRKVLLFDLTSSSQKLSEE